MKNFSGCCPLTSAPRRFGYLRQFAVGTCLLLASLPASTAEGSGLRLDQVLWRNVQNRQGENLGGLSDVLVQMPSGRDFILDWTGKRATHALVSPQITQVGRPDQMWFAIPVFLLSPALKSDALTVNSSLGALRRASPVSPEKGLPSDAGAAIHRYPAPPS